MCFSASASFSAASVLTVIGVVSIKKANHSSQYAFAFIPLIFAFQQFSEGFLWLNLIEGGNLKIVKIATYSFIFFAQLFWPVWVPFSIYLIETNSKQKGILKVLIASGILVSLYLLYCLIKIGAEAQIIEYHIAYIQKYPLYLRAFVIAFYATSTVVPLFISSIKNMWILGLSILISYLISVYFYHQNSLSVWCFFSSIISIGIYLIIRFNLKKVSISSHSLGI
jgi:hypothetical protein